MIVALHRFHGYGSLRGVYQRGQTARGAMIALRFSRRDPKRPYRVAVVVSRKVSKSAVVRNRIRRRLYELVRHQAEGISPGTDLIFTVFDEKVAELPPQRLQAVVSDLLRKTAAEPAARR
ncbi:MAG TPA: ribonuclease P protein component [Candidatus Saccharimonadales bacterium]